MLGYMVVWWLAPLPHSKRVREPPGLNPGLSVWSLHLLPVCMRGFSPGTPASSHHQSMHVRLIGDSKLTLRVNVSIGR